MSSAPVTGAIPMSTAVLEIGAASAVAAHTVIGAAHV